MGDLVYFRGPGPRQPEPAPVRPAPSSSSPSGCICFASNRPEGPCPLHAPQPTFWIEMPAGVAPHIANPNVCDVCRRAPHADTAHHRFEAARASVAFAKSLGWPMPPEQDLLV